MKNKVFRGWWMVVIAAIGIGLSTTMFFATGYSVLTNGMNETFGWQIAETALGATLFLSAQALGYPLSGLLADRWGSQRVIQMGLMTSATLLLLLSQISSLWQFYLLLFSLGLVCICTYSVPYFRVISAWFIHKRGMALGCSAAGAALGAVIFPIMLQKIITDSGWSPAIMAVAALQLLVCLPLVTFALKNAPGLVGERPLGLNDSTGAAPKKPQRAVDTVDKTPAQAFKAMEFWVLCSIFFTAGLGTYSVMPNAVAILTHGGTITADQAAKAIALAGAAIMVGRILGGYLLDKMNPMVLGLITALMLSVGWAAWATVTAYPLLLVAGFLFGLANGGENDVLPYLVMRFFGHQHFGKLFGLVASSFSVGAALGPVTYSALTTYTESLTQPILIVALINGVVGFGYLALNKKSTASPLAAGTTTTT